MVPNFRCVLLASVSIAAAFREHKEMKNTEALFSNVTSAWGSYVFSCPGSAAWGPHAKMEMTVVAFAACAAVKEEMLARIHGNNGWYDPHNKGTYTIIDDYADAAELHLSRKTGNGKYTDKLNIGFLPSRSDQSCTIRGCSESQVSSVLDMSTNYCNLRMLYCGSAEGCRPVEHDFAIQGEALEGSVGAGKDPQACLAV
mmetsp:Transcript_6492/g.13385  ORF Transcript_6492/g.13385 Transcript_6492/m.13385 type:complete len:199 (-) Transcript_6492:39-635(-)